MPLAPSRARRALPTSKLFTIVLALLVGAVGLPALATSASAAPASGAGYDDFDYSLTSGGPTEVTYYHSQSKLWFNDGRWWSIMWRPNAARDNGKWTINYLDMASQNWTDTGVEVDTRDKPHYDVFSDGNTLYVAASNDNTATAPIQVYTFNYSSGSHSYALAGPFGTIADAVGVNYASITKAGGKLWIAYTQSNKVWTTSSSDGTAWTPSAELTLTDAGDAPSAGGPHGNGTGTDDVAVVTPINSGVGVMWSRSSVAGSPASIRGGFFFATNTGSGWSAEGDAWVGDWVGDNHVSVKTASDGRVIAAVKSSLNSNPGGPNSDPLIAVLERSAGGTWSNPDTPGSNLNVSSVQQAGTRPMLVLDEGANEADVFLTEKVNGGAIYRRTAPLDSLDFGAPSLGSKFIDSSANPALNDSTSTKQPIDSTTNGLVVLASDRNTKNYAHNCVGGPCPATLAASFTATPTAAQATVPVQFTDTTTGNPSTWAWDFGDGATSTDPNPSHAYAAAGTYHATLTVTNVLGTDTSLPTDVVVSEAPAGPVGNHFVPKSPLRVKSGLTIGPSGSATLTIPTTSVPATATAVALNIAATKATGTTIVSACAPQSPISSTCRRQGAVRVKAGQQSAGFTISQLGGAAHNQVLLYNSAGTTTMNIDVQGWFVSDTTKANYYRHPTASRVLKAKKVGATYTFAMPASVAPAGTVAVVLNVTANGASKGTRISVCKGHGSVAGCKAHPNLYVAKGQTAASQVVALLGVGRSVRLVSSRGTANVTVDVQGWYAVGSTPGGAAYRTAPVGSVTSKHGVPGGSTYTATIAGLPAGSTSVALRVTASSKTQNGYISVCRGGTSTTACRSTSVLPVRKGENSTNVVIVALGAGGTVKFYSAGNSQLWVDAIGSFGP